MVLFLTLLASAALSEQAYYINSSDNGGRLARIGDAVYCLGAAKPLGMAVTVYRVTGEDFQPVVKRGGIQKIYAYQGKLLLMRDYKSLIDMFAKGEAGKTILEIFDTKSGKLQKLNISLPEDATAYSLSVVDDVIYSRIYDENGQKFFWMYYGPDEAYVLPLKPDEFCHVLPSCILLKTEKRKIIKEKYKLTVLDFEAIERLEVTLSCTDPYELVLADNDLYYLSGESVRRRKTAENTDELLMHTAGTPNSFSIRGDKIWLFYTKNDLYRAELYDMTTGDLLQSVSLTVPPVDMLVNDEVLYAYYLYGENPQIERVDLTTNTHCVYTLDAKK